VRIERDGIGLNVEVDGPEDGAPVLFLHALGTSLGLFDGVLAGLPEGPRLIRADMRGHGASDVPPAPYTMGALVSDAEAVLAALGATGAVVVGVSIGGMIAQGLAAKRLDLVRAMVLSNTGAKIGTPEMWADRIAAVRAGGIEALADAITERWFSAAFRDTDEFVAWRNMLTRQPPEGYMGCSAAISGTDLITPTSGLRLPTLGIAGTEDGSTPPDLVRETVDLVQGARFHLVRGAGHLPCVERPEEYAEVLTGFLQDVGHG